MSVSSLWVHYILVECPCDVTPQCDITTRPRWLYCMSVSSLWAHYITSWYYVLVTSHLCDVTPMWHHNEAKLALLDECILILCAFLWRHTWAWHHEAEKALLYKCILTEYITYWYYALVTSQGQDGFSVWVYVYPHSQFNLSTLHTGTMSLWRHTSVTSRGQDGFTVWVYLCILSVCNITFWDYPCDVTSMCDITMIPLSMSSLHAHCILVLCPHTCSLCFMLPALTTATNKQTNK